MSNPSDTESTLDQATFNWFTELKNSILSGQELLSRENRVKDADGFIDRPAGRQGGWIGGTRRIFNEITQ